MLQHKLHLISADGPILGDIYHASPSGIPDVSRFSHSCARRSFSTHAAPTSAFWDGDTRVTVDTAETALLSVVSWSFLSCSKATRASSGRWCAFPGCCCLRSSGTQLPPGQAHLISHTACDSAASASHSTASCACPQPQSASYLG